MQSNLRSLFAGKREVVEEPTKRGPGRPPKVRKREGSEVEDAVVEAINNQLDSFLFKLSVSSFCCFVLVSLLVSVDLLGVPPNKSTETNRDSNTKQQRLDTVGF